MYDASDVPTSPHRPRSGSIAKAGETSAPRTIRSQDEPAFTGRHLVRGTARPYTRRMAQKKDGMKLAEALLLRADIQKKIASLRDRIVANAVVQEGEKPNEDPNALLLEATGALADLETLVGRINKANIP